MGLSEFLELVSAGTLLEGGSDAHRFMHAAAQQALRITATLNGGYRTPEEVRSLLAELTGRPIDESVAFFPPLYSEFGKNLTLGRTCSSTWATDFSTPAASPSGTVRWSATAAP